MTEQQLTRRRRVFFGAIAAIATTITLLSAVATFTINLASFADWPRADELLALLGTIGVEVTFTLALIGIADVFTARTEKGIGVALLLGTLAIMATNYVTHHQMTTGVILDQWQLDYIQWIGPLSLFFILTMIVGIIVFNHDAQERRIDREYAFAAKRKALEWRKEQLESAEFEDHMDQYKGQVFEEARRSLKLPALAQRRIGLQPADYDDPKGQKDQEG